MPNPILQASAIPFRWRGGRLEFCLITSSNRGHWGFPKGIIEVGDTAEETALIEAHEEAGLRGHIVGRPIGEYRYQKWGTDLDVTVYLMVVDSVDDEWQEAEMRKREWVNADEAAARVADNESVSAVFSAALRQITSLPRTGT
jgi:8-oxo-dGTP pyrophosphatase MutT (NUDIX family)